MLTWETVVIAAYLNDYAYTITRELDEPDEWGVEITDPDGGVVVEVCASLEEAKQYCENTAAAFQAEQE